MPGMPCLSVGYEQKNSTAYQHHEDFEMSMANPQAREEKGEMKSQQQMPRWGGAMARR